jgi:hypothetical protein
MEQAIGLVPEFENVVRKLDHQVELLLAVGYWQLAFGGWRLAFGRNPEPEMSVPEIR